MTSLYLLTVVVTVAVTVGVCATLLLCKHLYMHV